MDKKYKEDFLKAGEIAGKVRSYGLTLIKPGASYNDVITKVLLKIAELGGEPAFPPQIALNECAAHFLPEPDEDIIFKDQVISLDVGVSVNGAIGDCETTIDLSGKYQHIVDASREALIQALQTIKVGVKISEIGAAIENIAKKHGLEPVRNLSGHGLDKYVVHTTPSIPNYNTQSDEIIRPGMTFAVEPFITDGKGIIYDAGNPKIFSFTQKRAIRSPITKEILKKITAKQGLPFSIHELVNHKTPLFKVKYALQDLLRNNVIQGYAPLIDENKGIVAQSENTVLVDEDGTVIITTEPDCLK